MVKNGLKAALMLVAMLALLWWFFSSVDGSGVMDALQQIQWGWLAGALLLTVFHYVLRAWRWGLLLSPIRAGIPFRPLFDAILAGYAVTFLITRVGEIVRPAYLARRERLPFASVLTTVGLDRLLDAGAIATLLVVYLVVGPSTGPGALAPEMAGTMRSRGLVAMAALIAFFAALALAVRWRRRWAGTALSSTGERGLLRTLLDGLGVLETARGFLGASGQSILIWMVLCAQIFCGVRAFGIDLPYVASFVVIPFLALGIAMPLPGGVGGYHAAGRFALVDVLGVAETTAVASILVLHLVSVLPAIALGGWVILRSGLSLGDLLRGEKSSDTPGGRGETGSTGEPSRGSAAGAVGSSEHRNSASRAVVAENPGDGS